MFKTLSHKQIFAATKTTADSNGFVWKAKSTNRFYMLHFIELTIGKNYQNDMFNIFEHY